MSVILLSVFASVLATLLLQLGMRLGVASVLTALGAAGIPLALGACLSVAAGWGLLQAWLWPRMLEDDEWRPWLGRFLAALGTVTILVSLHHFWFSGTPYPRPFLILCHLQLLVTFAWVCMAAGISGSAEATEVPEVGAAVARVVSLTTAVGLAAYAFPLSNFAGLRPEASPQWYLLGCQIGTLTGMLTTPMCVGARVPLIVAVAVNLGVSNPYLSVLAQLALSALTLLPGRTGSGALAAAWRLTLGMTAGRIVGRIVGFLLVGQEGIALLEPIAEVVVGVLSLRRSER